MILLFFSLIAPAFAQSTPLSCDERGNASAINAGAASLPRQIVHFGPTRYIAEDVAARTIPQTAWDRFIMGDDGRWALRPWRRGLYGTIHPLEAAPYGSSAEDTMMVIHVRQSCLRAEAVASPGYVTAHAAWLPWFRGASALPFSTQRDYERSCFDAEGWPINVNWLHASGDDDRMVRDCETMYERFFDEARIRVVHDPMTPGSYYIRDRSCIEMIRGTPGEMMQYFAGEPRAWIPGCVQNPFYFVTIRVFLDALSASSDEDRRQHATTAISAMRAADPSYGRVSRAIHCAWDRLGTRISDLISRFRPELQLQRVGSDEISHDISEIAIRGFEEACAGT